MNSEKVKEIKKALGCCQGENPNCTDCSYWYTCKKDYGVKLRSDILTLIKELESENEQLRQELKDYPIMYDICNEREYRKKFNDEWRKEYQKELDKQGNGHIAGYPDFDLVYKLYFEQKDRIAELENIGLNEEITVGEYLREMQRLKDRVAELEKENAIKTDTIVDLLKKQEFYEKEKLTKFAERLKEKCEYNRKQYCCSATVGANDIDETLKEFIK